jgi:DNA primase small subunit
VSGPPTAEAIERTVAWATSEFGRYYARNDAWLPPRFGRREFGFLPIAGKFFDRHRSFRDREDLRRYMASRAPGHAYYSVAYYQRPDAPTMREKGWLGADLVFDLDADHLPDVRAGKDVPFDDQLARVKEEAEKLLQNFVLGAFGFDEDHVRVVFSGGRGYHIHVDDPRVQQMGAAERREVVDHVTALGLDTSRLFREHGTKAVKVNGKLVVTEKAVRLAPGSGPDWGGMIRDRTHSQLAALAEAPEDEARRQLLALEGVGPKHADKFLEAVRSDRNLGGTALDRLQADGNVSKIVQLLGKRALESLPVQAINDEKGEADEPVTADIKRLIRLPASIHGKTGLRVVPIAIDRLAGFDPLADALAFGTEPVDVVVSKPERVRMGAETFVPAAGPQTLPKRVALFLVLRRRALLAH